MARARNWRHRAPVSQEQVRVLQVLMKQVPVPRRLQEQVQGLKASRQLVPVPRKPQEQVQVLKASRQRVPGQHRLQEPIPEEALGAPQRQVRS